MYEPKTCRASAILAAACVAACSPAADEASSRVERAAEPAAAPQPCDRACLTGFIDRYLEAFVARDPSRLPLAPNVTFVENNQSLAIGDGTWRTVTGLGGYRHDFIDVTAGQAAMIGVVEENGTKAIYDLRLAVAAGEITEIEVLIARDPSGAALYEERGAPHEKFLEVVPPQARLPRAELIAVADKYLSGMQRNDPNGDYSFFHDECDRWEHARRTTNNDPEAYGHSTDTVFVTLNCGEQFATGFLGFVTRIRDRRYVVVDEEHQTVLGFALLDHNGTIREIPLSSGTTFVVPPYFSTPRTLQVGEAWRIEDGKLRQIEMTLTEVPYGTQPGFDSGDDWLARDAATNPIAATPAASDACDRACLVRIAERVIEALVAHDATRAPLAPNVRYTENGQTLNPGDGLWGTVTARGADAAFAADPATGAVGFFGSIVETDVQGKLALRIAVVDGRITEIEALAFRDETVGERGGTLTLHAPRRTGELDPAVFAQAQRERRMLVADAERGVSIELALLDVPNDRRAGASTALPLEATGPYTVVAVQVREAREGGAPRIQTSFRPVAYGADSGWQ
jgi:hypothetical protein